MSETVTTIRAIRPAARAIVIHDGKLLAAKMRDRQGVYYILPGGGQQPGETLREAVVRECMEECGVEVEVQELLYVREYIGKNHTFSDRHARFHQLEHVFRCRVLDPHAVVPGGNCDNHQVGVNWLALEAMAAIRFYPEVIKPFFTADGIEVPCIYLGDCN
ncbi:MAG: NUDIX domain-containing protein [Opitutales bacterium]|nr:NUDIX domain-containing protein [Opitutales bacterium]